MLKVSKEEIREMKKTINTSIRQEDRIKAIEATLSDSERGSFMSELDEAPKYVFPFDYVWDVIHRWEHLYV